MLHKLRRKRPLSWLKSAVVRSSLRPVPFGPRKISYRKKILRRSSTRRKEVQQLWQARKVGELTGDEPEKRASAKPKIEKHGLYRLHAGKYLKERSSKLRLAPTFISSSSFSSSWSPRVSSAGADDVQTKAQKRDRAQLDDEGSYSLSSKIIAHFSEPSSLNTWSGVRPASQSLLHEELQTDDIPSYGRDSEELWQKIRCDLIPFTVPTQSPGFMGHMTADIPAESSYSDIMISHLNQNMVKRETSGLASDVERQVIRWFHRLIYGRYGADGNGSEDDASVAGSSAESRDRPDSSYYYRESWEANFNEDHGSPGLILSGGTLANVVALTVARNHALPGVHRWGLVEALKKSGYRRAVVLTSIRSHYSIAKACALIGLGAEQLITVDVVPRTQKMNMKALQRKIVELQSDNTLILAVVGLAGSTETGSVDDLDAMATLCQARKVWLHVDGAWGGAYLLSPKLSGVLRGIERADSVVIDAHKMLGLTMGGGMVFFRQPSHTQTMSQSAHYVLRRGSDDLGRYHLEGSRPFYALKIWMLCLSRGREGLARIVEECHGRSLVFQKVILREKNFVLMTPLQTSILTYQWCPPPLAMVLGLFAGSDLGQKLEELLNNIHDGLHRAGWLGELPGFVSKTRLILHRKPQCPVEMVVLRAIPVGSGTTPWYVQDLLKHQDGLARELFGRAFDHLKARLTAKDDALAGLELSGYEEGFELTEHHREAWLQLERWSG